MIPKARKKPMKKRHMTISGSQPTAVQVEAVVTLFVIIVSFKYRSVVFTIIPSSSQPTAAQVEAVVTHSVIFPALSLCRVSKSGQNYQKDEHEIILGSVGAT